MNDSTIKRRNTTAQENDLIKQIRDSIQTRSIMSALAAKKDKDNSIIKHKKTFLNKIKNESNNKLFEEKFPNRRNSNFIEE